MTDSPYSSSPGSSLYRSPSISSLQSNHYVLAEAVKQYGILSKKANEVDDSAVADVFELAMDVVSYIIHLDCSKSFHISTLVISS
jgi:hypothetical protein